MIKRLRFPLRYAKKRKYNYSYDEKQDGTYKNHDGKPVLSQPAGVSSCDCAFQWKSVTNEGQSFSA